MPQADNTKWSPRSLTYLTDNMSKAEILSLGPSRKEALRDLRRRCRQVQQEDRAKALGLDPIRVRTLSVEAMEIWVRRAPWRWLPPRLRILACSLFGGAFVSRFVSARIGSARRRD